MRVNLVSNWTWVHFSHGHPEWLHAPNYSDILWLGCGLVCTSEMCPHFCSLLPLCFPFSLFSRDNLFLQDLPAVFHCYFYSVLDSGPVGDNEEVFSDVLANLHLRYHEPGSWKCGLHECSCPSSSCTAGPRVYSCSPTPRSRTFFFFCLVPFLWCNGIPQSPKVTIFIALALADGSFCSVVKTQEMDLGRVLTVAATPFPHYLPSTPAWPQIASLGKQSKNVSCGHLVEFMQGKQEDANLMSTALRDFILLC